MPTYEFKENADQGTGVYLLEGETVIHVPKDALSLLDDTNRTKLPDANAIGNSGGTNAFNFVQAIPD